MKQDFNMNSMLKKIFLQGYIPNILKIKKVLYCLAWVIPFSIFFMYGDYKDFASAGWAVLIGVVSIRPLADIFPDLKIFRTLVILRREFGVFAGMMFLAHFVGYLLINHISMSSIFTNKSYWNLNGMYVWGMMGIFIAIPLLVTSNRRAIIFLKTRWKIIQRFSYLLLLLGGIHQMAAGKWDGMIAVLLVAILWLLARVKFQIKIPKTRC